ncbi:hypothetical protein N7491_009440 [Penicillium cf. griseofulvum]|uniref:Uncharacterized protein n=1 Tax=Penicillium cf. griseofulvum TaxID=2972120 RepID=A0A9W9MFA1_9EURO|nr:hypothetical protein N7472_004968 [Penicillium cf. griseofulvum]KAJ5424224.1 hypothetical protein N7491_009440 [Penicillium cf. griseofulvum]KAJ5442537.1 hypothetical protein N7445_005544 [Penicillium cf. griseofulvum]
MSQDVQGDEQTNAKQGICANSIGQNSDEELLFPDNNSLFDADHFIMMGSLGMFASPRQQDQHFWINFNGIERPPDEWMLMNVPGPA